METNERDKDNPCLIEGDRKTNIIRRTRRREVVREWQGRGRGRENEEQRMRRRLTD